MLGQLVALGADSLALKLLYEKDDYIRAMYIEIANRAVEAKEIIDKNLAAAIVNGVGNLLGAK